MHKTHPSKPAAGALRAALAAALLFGPVAIAPVQAAGGGGTTVTTPSCKRGHMWDRSKKKCVRVKKSSGLSDEDAFIAGRSLAYEGRYEEALSVLALVGTTRDPRILNYRGYATRKAGDVEGALKHYYAALDADPDYTLVREYLGEAFLSLGRIDDARAQLSEIAARCGRDCREYAMLERAIVSATR